MSQFLIWAKLCAGKSAIGLSIYVQNAGDFMRRKRQGYALSDNDELMRYSLSCLVKNLDFTHILGERFFPELLLSLSGLGSMSEQVFRGKYHDSIRGPAALLGEIFGAQPQTAG